MRGDKIKERMITCVGLGITPAYAGIREDAFHPEAQAKDHPRIRGDK